jgi:hypothetical protein
VNSSLTAPDASEARWVGATAVELDADADVDEVAAVEAVLAVLVVWNIDWKLVIATMTGTPFWSEAPTGAPICPTEDDYLKRLSQAIGAGQHGIKGEFTLFAADGYAAGLFFHPSARS